MDGVDLCTPIPGLVVAAHIAKVHLIVACNVLGPNSEAITSDIAPMKLSGKDLFWIIFRTPVLVFNDNQTVKHRCFPILCDLVHEASWIHYILERIKGPIIAEKTEPKHSHRIDNDVNITTKQFGYHF